MYNHGMCGLEKINNISEDELFSLIDEMQTMLSIIGTTSKIFELKLEE